MILINSIETLIWIYKGILEIKKENGNKLEKLKW